MQNSAIGRGPHPRIPNGSELSAQTRRQKQLQRLGLKASDWSEYIYIFEAFNPYLFELQKLL